MPDPSDVRQPAALETPARRAWLDQQGHRLLELSLASATTGGFGWSDGDGGLLPRELQLWMTARMTHVLALGHLLGHAGSAAGAEHGIAALAGPFHDEVDGGWFAALAPDGSAPADTTKGAYAHAFVILAASSATVAAVPGARELLDEALAVHAEHFLDADAGVVRESFARDFTDEEDYRGANAAMHTVEAYLAATDATGDDVWRQRALNIADLLVNVHARAHGWRLPEHFTATMTPLLDHHADRVADPFRPFGTTPGHGLEWARLLLGLRDGLGEGAPPWLADGAVALFSRAVEDGWAPDGREGFVYTTGFDGAPVVTLRQHWVLCEAIGAAAALHRATGEESYAQRYEQWWAYAERAVVDLDDGSWVHELDADGQPSSVLWEGRPDTYHAFQATLVGALPLAPTFASAVAVQRGLG